ncbi:chitin binding protein, partial [Pyrenochaeta sp. DS3sAY3a]
MHLLRALAVVAVAAPFISAYDGSATLKIVGVNIRDLKARSILASMAEKSKLTAARHQEARGNLDSRQNTDGQCGPGFGSCAAGSCCNEDGWCGTGPSFCYSPGCQYAYGPACPENAQPAGTNLSSVPRTKFGSVLYGGEGIYECVRYGDVAITFDDGPLQDYTNNILNIFRAYNAKATFFVTGNNFNKGQIDLTPAHTATIQRAYAEGHQIASHTWTHLDLSAIRTLDRKNQMWKNEMALRNILGFFPTYMRPPYNSCTAASGCEKDMADLGYHITYYNVDTDDKNQDSRTQIQNSKNWFRGNITAGGATPASSKWLTLAHDVQQQTAYNLTDYMLSTITSLGYRAVTVGECLGDPVANWYRSGAGTPNPVSSSKVTIDATCGGVNGFTCQGSTFGNCCSVHGWCGSTAAYCGTGCQPAFGTCAGASQSSSLPVNSSTRPASSSTRTSSSATPASTKKVSTDATCGGRNGYTCQGSTFGNCCSVNGWCGASAAYCGTGCQPAFGSCT